MSAQQRRAAVESANAEMKARGHAFVQPRHVLRRPRSYQIVYRSPPSPVMLRVTVDLSGRVTKTWVSPR
jgi:hypothetical protein